MSRPTRFSHALGNPTQVFWDSSQSPTRLALRLGLGVSYAFTEVPRELSPQLFGDGGDAAYVRFLRLASRTGRALEVWRPGGATGAVGRYVVRVPKGDRRFVMERLPYVLLSVRRAHGTAVYDPMAPLTAIYLPPGERALAGGRLLSLVGEGPLPLETDVANPRALRVHGNAPRRRKEVTATVALGQPDVVVEDHLEGLWKRYRAARG